MHRSAAWGLSAALAVGATAPAFAADPTPPEPKPWYARLAGGDSAKKPEPEKTFGNTPPRPAVILGPMDPAAMAEALKAEQDAYQRRLDVCLKLRTIAAQTNNDPLAARADDLEKRATALYNQRTAKLGVKAALRAPADVIDGKLGTGAAVDPLTVAPPKPLKSDATATASADKFREVARD